MSDISVATCAYVRELKESLFGTSRYWHIFPALHQSRLRISSSGAVEFPHLDLAGVENPMCLYGINFAMTDDESRPVVICKDEASAFTGHIVDPGSDYLAVGDHYSEKVLPGWVATRRIFIAPDLSDYETDMHFWKDWLNATRWLCIDSVFPDYEDAIRHGTANLDKYYQYRFKRLQETEPYKLLRTLATLSNGSLDVEVWAFMRSFQLYIKS